MVLNINSHIVINLLDGISEVSVFGALEKPSWLLTECIISCLHAAEC